VRRGVVQAKKKLRSVSAVFCNVITLLPTFAVSAIIQAVVFLIKKLNQNYMFKSRLTSVVAAALALASLALPANAVNAALTISATSIASDSNLILSPASSIGIGNANPQSLLHVGTAGSRAGIMKLDGLTSGTVTIQPASVAGAWTLTLPTSAGSNGQVLTTNGSGVTSWTTIAGGGVSCSSCTPNLLPVWNGSNLVDSAINYDENNGVLKVFDITSSGKPGLRIDLSARIALLGNETKSALRVDTINQTNSLTAGTESIAIDGVAHTIKAQTTGTFCAGDCNVNNTGTNILVNPSSEAITLATGGSAYRGLLLDFSNHLFQLGDIDNNGSSTLVTVDESASKIFLNAENGVFINGVKKYVALLSQSGTDAPVATVLENTLGGTVVWTRSGPGDYNATLVGTFTENKTWATVSGVGTGGSDPATAMWNYASADLMELYTKLVDTQADDVLVFPTAVEIRVYP
jgi:hypothetical protein